MEWSCGSRKRPYEEDNKDQPESAMKVKQLCLQQDLLGGLPNELWAKIVPYLGIRDWGRLEPVSSHFRSLLLKHSWTTLETLTVDPDQFCLGEHNHKTIEIRCNSFPKFHVTFFHASKLLRGIAEKVPKLVSLEMPNFLEWCEDEKEPLSALGLLPRLACTALRKFEISTYIRSMGAVGDVAEVLGQTKETLTELDLCLLVDEDLLIGATEVLKPVLESLTSLETLSITCDGIGSSPRHNEYLLMNKPKLTSLSLKLEFLSDEDNEYNYLQPARALLKSTAKLESFFLYTDYYYGDFLSEYEKQLGSTSGLHPLSSLKRFDSHYHWDLSPDGLKLLRLCPNLEEIYDIQGTLTSDFCVDEWDSLIGFMAAFLNEFASGQREKVLQLNLPYSQENFQEEEVGRLEELTGPLIKTVQNVPCPKFRYAFRVFLPSVPVKVFRKRNALFRLALASR